MKKQLSLCIAALILFSSYAIAGTWETFDAPGATNTYLYGIDGSNIVGNYWGSSGSNSFLYDGTNLTTLNIPAPPMGISGNNIVGTFTGSRSTSGFIYDGTSWTALFAEGRTWLNGISGNKMVGAGGSGHGFLYDGANWTYIDVPGSYKTSAQGICGNNIVGYYDKFEFRHGFLYDGVTWTTLDAPGAFSTHANGISGSNIVGYYSGTEGLRSGFLFDGSTWTTLNFPGAKETMMYGISGDNIVGSYKDYSNKYHGFVYTIPEPCTLLLLGLGAAVLRKK